MRHIEWGSERAVGFAEIDGRRFTIVTLPAALRGLHWFEASDNDGQLVGQYSDGTETRPMDGAQLASAEQLLGEYAAMNHTSHVHAADGDGQYLGLMPPSDAPMVVPCAPPTPGSRFVDGGWVVVVPLEQAKATALADIDRAAGAARLRYITEVPGQQGVYLRKYDQARAYLEQPDAENVPPYVQAEADAMGLTPAEAAQHIVAIAQQWDDVVSPAIERERLMGKRLALAAETTEAVATITAAAIAALASI